MFAFIVRRFGQAILVIFVVSFIGFSMQSQFGDPIRDLGSERVTKAEREVLRTKLGLNDPFLVRYIRFLNNALHGNLGLSYFYKKPAVEVILTKAPATIELTFVSTLIIAFFSIPIGIFAAIQPRHWLTRFFMGTSIIGVSIPVFLTAIMLIYLFAVELSWFPSFGRGELIPLGGWNTGLLTLDGWHHIILPAVALSSIMLPLFIRLIRSEMMEVLHSEYIKFAWAKGLPRRRIWFLHAFKNTLLPVITVGGVQIGTMIAFTILTETVFQWQGLGFLFLEAVERSDTTLLVAYLMFVGLIFVITNTLVDIIYGLVNPMVRITGKK
jgi:peptide/nickel transport system permease protein